VFQDEVAIRLVKGLNCHRQAGKRDGNDYVILPP
jgi:hypothetical protein